MTRVYALARLLQHGPLTPHDIREITGWKPLQCGRAINALHARRETRRVHLPHGYVYELTDIARVPPLST